MTYGLQDGYLEEIHFHLRCLKALHWKERYHLSMLIALCAKTGMKLDLEHYRIVQKDESHK